MITIGKIRFAENNPSKIEAVLNITGREDFTLFVETDPDYGQFLVTERADAFLVGTLMYGLMNGHDITCTNPVTSDLVFMLENQLIPILCKYEDRFHPVKIFCETVDGAIPNAGAVGTGNSLGVDSFCTIAEAYQAKSENMRLTHLCTFNSGVLGGYYQRNNWDYCAAKLYEREQRVADELGLPMIHVESNLPNLMRVRTDYYGTNWILLHVMSLAKLFRTYYVSSNSADYAKLFNLERTCQTDNSTYDLLTLQCVSYQGGIRFISGGGEKDRGEKLKTVAQFPIGRRNLQSCQTEHYNCMMCDKCRRNLTHMDALGLLDDFSEAYDIPYYRAHREEYIRYLCDSVHSGLHGVFLEPAYELLKQREPELIAKFEKSMPDLTRERNELERQRNVLRDYTRMFRKALEDDDYARHLRDWFRKSGIQKVIVYGSEQNIGFPYFASVCKKHGVTISHVVENVPRGQTRQYPHLAESAVEYPDCDAVIICGVERLEIIRKKLSYFVKAPVFTLQEVMEMKQG